MSNRPSTSLEQLTTPEQLATGDTPAAAALELAGHMFPTTVPCLTAAARYRIADALAEGPLP